MIQKYYFASGEPTVIFIIGQDNKAEKIKQQRHRVVTSDIQLVCLIIKMMQLIELSLLIWSNKI